MSSQSIANIVKQLRQESASLLVRETVSYSWTDDIHKAGVDIFRQKKSKCRHLVTVALCVWGSWMPK